jgi:hypothetical protein
MPDTRRQEIVDAIIARMQLISTANGYATNAGARVEDWPRRFDDSECPALGVCDVSEDSDKGDRESEIETRTLTVQVRIFVATNTPARTLRQIIGDVQKAVGVDQYWGELSTGTWPRRAGMIVPSEAMELAGAAVEFDVVYDTSTFNPFAVELEP